MTNGCPHNDIRFCPVYIASHGMQALDGTWIGCMSGNIEEGRCAVDRGKPYDREIQRINSACPGFVEQVAFRERAAAEWTAAEERRRKRRALWP